MEDIQSGNSSNSKVDKLFLVSIILIALQIIIWLGSDRVKHTAFEFIAIEAISNVILFFVPLLLITRVIYRKRPNPWKKSFRRALLIFAILAASGVYGFIFTPVPATTADDVIRLKTEVLHNSVLFYFLSLFDIN